jgi:hypothetical protein
VPPDESGRVADEPQFDLVPSGLRYIDLAGVLFRDEAEAAEARMFGTSTGSNGANG